tara:strand:- start:99 stop:410 length:312 start_codon:yes stop_codon:yes gene_type:complete
MINKKLILDKIDGTFKNRERNRIAKQCLEHAIKWTGLYGDLDANVRGKRTYLENFNACHQYIIDNFDKSQIKSFSIWAIILPTIISYVAKWVTQWVIDNLLND